MFGCADKCIKLNNNTTNNRSLLTVDFFTNSLIMRGYKFKEARMMPRIGVVYL